MMKIALVRENCYKNKNFHKTIIYQTQYTQ